MPSGPPDDGRRGGEAATGGGGSQGGPVDRLTSATARTSFGWLLAGVVPGAWRVWAAPTHAHVRFVGWFVQFVVGVACWLLPRRRPPARPLG